MRQQRAASVLVGGDDAAHLVHPFTAAGQIGFVVPRPDLVDRVAPGVPFELAGDEGVEILVFLDDCGPLPIEQATAAGGQVRITALAEALPGRGEHVLTVVHQNADGRMGTQSVLFATER